MFLAGMQKLSLLDYPGVVACTLFTLGCNFRCPWCHNAGLVLPEQFPKELPDPEEVLRFLEKRRGVLDGVCITGGEPLLHPEVPDFIRRLKELGYRVKLDTNGSFPERLRELAEEKLVDYVAMDIKNAPRHYGNTIGVPGYETGAVEESKNFLLTEPVGYERPAYRREPSGSGRMDPGRQSLVPAAIPGFRRVDRSGWPGRVFRGGDAAAPPGCTTKAARGNAPRIIKIWEERIRRKEHV